MGEVRSAFKILTSKLSRKRPIVRASLNKQVASNKKKWIASARYWDNWRALENAALNLRIPEIMELINQLIYHDPKNKTIKVVDIEIVLKLKKSFYTVITILNLGGRAAMNSGKKSHGDNVILHDSLFLVARNRIHFPQAISHVMARVIIRT